MEAKFIPRKILIIDDNIMLAKDLAKFLVLKGYIVDIANDGKSGIVKVLNNNYSLLLIDVDLPEKKGLDVTKYLRLQNIDLPIIIITGIQDQSYEIQSYINKANLFHRKPIKLDLLAEQINSLTLHRKIRSSLSIGNIYMEYETRLITINNIALKLPRREFDLLYYLGSNFENDPNKVCSKTEILMNIHPNWREVDEKTIDNIIYRLRKILREQNQKDIIEAVKAHGYRIKRD